MPRGRPKQPTAQVPANLALIDAEGRFHAIVQYWEDAVDAFIKLKHDEPISHEDAEYQMTVESWRIEKLTKPWLPHTDGFNLMFHDERFDRPTVTRPSDVENGLVIWL